MIFIFVYVASGARIVALPANLGLKLPPRAATPDAQPRPGSNNLTSASIGDSKGVHADVSRASVAAVRLAACVAVMLETSRK